MSDLKEKLRASLEQSDDIGNIIREIWAIADRLPAFDDSQYTEWSHLLGAITALQEKARRTVLGERPF